MRGKGEGSIFKNGRGLWTAVIELPSYDGTTRRRKVIRRKDKTELLIERDKFLERLKASGGDAPTRDMTVKRWVDEWFTTIALLEIRPKTAHTYRGLIKREIEPRIGDKKLEKLTVADVRAMNAAIVAAGLSSTTAAQVHRILSVALKAAVADGKIARNVAAMVKPPRRAATEMQALTLEEALKVLETAIDDPLGSLWATVLLTGARQGELLGLQRDRVTDVLELSWQLQRLPWEHGCSPACDQRAPGCPRRKITAPADYEHKALHGGLWLTRPKSRAGVRIVPLVDPLKAILERHIATTDGGPHNLVWTAQNGRPVDPRQEYKLWQELLERAGAPKVGIHAGRHTTADLLYAAGVPEDVISEILGHSSRAVTRGYKSKGNQARLTDAMNRMSALVTPRPALPDTPAELSA
jgi:integrase